MIHPEHWEYRNEHHWGQSYMQDVQDASRVNTEAVQRGNLRDEAFKKALTAQAQIAEALKRQAIALAEESEALLKLYEGDVDGFISKYGDSMNSTRQSVESTAKWIGSVSDGLYDNFESAFAKIAAVDSGFSNRNQGGFKALFEKLGSFVRQSSELIDRSTKAAHQVVDSVRQRWISAGDAVNAMKDRILVVSKSVASSSRAMASSTVDVAADATAMAASVTMSLARRLSKPINVIVGAVQDAIQDGVDTLDRRQADRFWSALTMATGRAGNDPDAMADGQAELERQLKHFGGWQSLSITPDGANLADHAFMIAENIIDEINGHKAGTTLAELKSANMVLEKISASVYQGRDIVNLPTKVLSQEQRLNIALRMDGMLAEKDDMTRRSSTGMRI